MDPGSLPRYVLITPARNEAAFIEKTIQSVISQTVLPLKWIIVSDGSTDGTDDIVSRYLADHPWMELIRMPERHDRNFAGKAYSFNAAYDRVQRLNFQIIGNLDADVSFEPDYFEFLLQKFVDNPRLGVGGTPFREGSFQYDFRFTNIEHVSGPIQLFRKRCFEDIGGYAPLRAGGVDFVAVMTARMRGWQTRTFLGKTYNHHRKMGTATHNRLAGAFAYGCVDYMLGCDPAWQFFRSVYRLVKQRPVVLAACFRLTGFLWAAATGVERVIPPELMRFRRAEERQRMGAFFQHLVPAPMLESRRPRATRSEAEVHVMPGVLD